MSLVKSKQRVADHGEVFTPPEFANRMIDTLAGAWAAERASGEHSIAKTLNR
ncbi:MAG: hypothetical protein V4773_09170 [Verrucomicrobiota bacterium]